MRKEHYTSKEFGIDIRNDVYPLIQEYEYHVSNIIDNLYMLDNFGEDPDLRQDIIKSEDVIREINANPNMIKHHLRNLKNLEIDLENNPSEPVLYQSHISAADFGHEIFEKIYDSEKDVDPNEETPIKLDALKEEIKNLEVELKTKYPEIAKELEQSIGEELGKSRDDVRVSEMF